MLRITPSPGFSSRIFDTFTASFGAAFRTMCTRLILDSPTSLGVAVPLQARPRFQQATEHLRRPFTFGRPVDEPDRGVQLADLVLAEPATIFRWPRPGLRYRTMISRSVVRVERPF
ncbi:hypothetical protein [Actinomadura terrae]|uniref:hypothetical protein n=1 Tax=Actinomadura terrae TaxID=604353 RepID=UPI001FA7DCA0|nr:hypothetical protein [Actinomadura terrae]